MKHNVYVYIFIMFAVTYCIRVLPLTLIRKPIKSRFIRSFLFSGSDDLSGYCERHGHAGFRLAGACVRRGAGVERAQPADRCGCSLCGGVRQ